jgi:hypothetical protein
MVHYKKWVKLLKTKGFKNIGPNSRVCSSHFPGGRKNYLNNVPTELAMQKNVKTRRQLFRPEIVTTTFEDKNVNVPINSKEVDVTEVCAPISNEIKMKEEIDTLKAKCNSLQKRVDEAEKCSFRLETFIGSDHDFKFYTGFPDCETFSAFF